MLLIHYEARPGDEREREKLAVQGYAGLTQIEKEPERDVRDRFLKVGPKGQSSECTEAGDLLGLPLVGVVPLIAVLKLHHIVFSLERLDLLCVILVNRVLKLLQMVVVPREVGFLTGF